MPLNQSATLAVNPLLLNSVDFQSVEQFFEMLGFDESQIDASPIQDSGAADPTAQVVAVVHYDANPLEGSRFGYARNFTHIGYELASFKRSVKAARDGFAYDALRHTLQGLLDDQAAFDAGSFTPPNGLSMPAYVKAVQEGLLATYPSIDV